MTDTRIAVTRRRILLAGGATLVLPGALRAADGPIKIGTLTPLTGAGGPYGPVMAKAAGAVIDQVNQAGGLLGRKLQLVSEDDQTNPEAGVRAARKLIDVDQVVAILGTWASSVTTAVAPLCWENKVFLCTVSGADSITELPHQGYLIRTQPNTTLQGRKFGEYALELGAKRVFYVLPQTPFTQSAIALTGAAIRKGGGEMDSLVYDEKKTTFRTELDQAMRYKPDLLILGGYSTDTGVLLKDIYRSDFKGKLIAFAYSVNQKLVDSLPPEASEGVYTIAPSPAQGSTGYQRLSKLIQVEAPDPYTCQAYDHANLVCLAIAQAKLASGTAIRDTVRQVSQGGGERVDNAVDGLQAIAAGRKVDYDGASGPCDFTERGDITDCRFRYDQVKAGKVTLLKIA